MTNRYGLEIRAAAGTEAAGLSELLTQAGHVVTAHDVAARLEDMRARGGVVLVALEWGPPSGVVAMHPVPSLILSRPVATIGLLLVAPAARRRGIGRMLIKAASQAARVAGCGSLEVVAATDAADLSAFYRSTGFVERGMVLARGLRKQGLA